MKILITGATGFVGTRLIESLFLKGHDDVRVLTRNKAKTEAESPFPIQAFEWDINKKTIDAKALENVDAIVHLAGESVAEGRWTEAKKARILESRVKSTTLLMETIKKLKQPPKKFICASAIGIYGDRGDETLDTDSILGAGFLADVCKKWEQLAHDHGIAGMKCYSLRTGIVLGRHGGALKKMLPAFKAGVAGRLGDGKQYMSWIHLDDLVGQYIFLIENEAKYPVYDGVGPKPVTNLEFTKTLGQVLKRPTLFPVPKAGLKLLFGEMSEILIGSQRVVPSRFISEGYQFKFQHLKAALEDILKYDVNSERVLKKYQWIKEPPDKVFDFFSNEHNLEQITPPYLKFKVVGKNTKQIQEGTLIDYRLSLHGLPMKWQSRINNFVHQRFFIDEQITGPYAKWVHSHDFIPARGGTLIKDEVVYKLPLGIAGELFAGHFVNRDLQQIFKYRQKIIGKLFNQTA